MLASRLVPSVFLSSAFLSRGWDGDHFVNVGFSVSMLCWLTQFVNTPLARGYFGHGQTYEVSFVEFLKLDDQ